MTKVANASCIQDAYDAVIEMSDWGGEAATRYLVKGLLTPIGIVDVLSGRRWFQWSHQALNIPISGPNCNKWLNISLSLDFVQALLLSWQK